METLAAVFFWLFIVAITAVCCFWLTSKFVAMKLKLFSFCCNPIGGKWAICFGADLANSNKVLNGKRLVRDTLTFDGHPASYTSVPYLREVADLFVPGISGGLMPIIEQERYFMPPEEVAVFIQRKQKEALSNDRFLRFAVWWDEQKIGDFGCLLVVMTVMLFFVWLTLPSVQRNAIYGVGKVIVYTTTLDGKVEKSEMTRATMDKFFMPSSEDASLIKSRVASLQNIGGGLALACTEKSLCGFASSSSGIKIGDVVFVRSGTVKIAREKSYGGQYTETSWLLTQREGEALLATGKFTLAD